jgi:hypothetical protein
MRPEIYLIHWRGMQSICITTAIASHFAFACTKPETMQSAGANPHESLIFADRN